MKLGEITRDEVFIALGNRKSMNNEISFAVSIFFRISFSLQSSDLVQNKSRQILLPMLSKIMPRMEFLLKNLLPIAVSALKEKDEPYYKQLSHCLNQYSDSLVRFTSLLLHDNFMNRFEDEFLNFLQEKVSKAISLNRFFC